MGVAYYMALPTFNAYKRWKVSLKRIHEATVKKLQPKDGKRIPFIPQNNGEKGALFGKHALLKMAQTSFIEKFGSRGRAIVFLLDLLGS